MMPAARVIDNAIAAPDDYEQSGEDRHVYPTFGPPHVMWDRCWCNPERDEEEPRVVVHNVVH